MLASDLVSVFERLSSSWGDQMNIVLRNAILAFLESPTAGTLRYRSRPVRFVEAELQPLRREVLMASQNPAKNLGRRYALIPKTVAYMVDHGVQQTLNTFTADPLHLVNAISNSNNLLKRVNLS